jgi:glycogen debranching enzyme
MEATELDKYFIQSTASFAEVATHVLKDGDSFAIFDNHGDFTPAGNREQGVFHDGTRFLSRFVLRMFSRAPTLLQAGVHRNNTLLSVDLTNPDCSGDNGLDLPHGSIHVFRAKMLYHGAMYEHLRIRSFAKEAVEVPFSFQADADFADIFEIRGTGRERRGDRLSTEVSADEIVLGYRGLDDVVRRTRLHFSPAPDRVSEEEASYTVRLEPKEHFDVFITAYCEQGDEAPRRRSYDEAKDRVRAKMQRRQDAACEVTTSNQQFNAWIVRSQSDLHMLLSRLPEGLYPYAGIPWFSTVFGRDGLLTALMSLWINPDIARGVLAHLAATQADDVDVARDAQPGKILHEARGGEMAALREVPFGRYYGSVDSTPLFVALAGHYFEHTGDRAFIEQIWPNIERALAWIDEHADPDGDGFIEYWRTSEDGLSQQGWKDSDDPISHADGSLAEAPIALCEAQAYVYDAKRRAAEMAAALGQEERAARLREQAEALKQRFDATFWLDDLGTYALALDGSNRPCRVRSSNAGHALLSGIVPEERAQRLVETLFRDDSFCGWGIRTLSRQEARFNPMAYHNGSIWPHDNAVIGAGLGRYGFKREVHRLLEVFFEASLYDPNQRLPELFCGFDRQSGQGPTRYPVACSPQAWATVVVFQLLQAALGLEVYGAERRVVLRRPLLPDFLERVTIRNLRVGDSCVDLACHRYEENVGVKVTRCDGASVDVEIFV